MARSRQAALVLPKPREMTSATSLRGCLRAGTERQRRRIGILLAQAGDARHGAGAQRAEGQHRVDQPGRGQQVAEGPLEAGDRRHVGAEHVSQRARLGAVGVGRAVAVGHDQAHVGRLQRGTGQRGADGAHQAVAVVAHRQQAQRFAAAAEAQHLAQHGGAAFGGGGLGFQRQRRRAFAHRAAVVARVEGPQPCADSRPSWW